MARAASVVCLGLVLSGCGGCRGPAQAPADGAPEAGTVAAPMTAEERRLWDEAQGGDEGELGRLASAAGVVGIGERAADPALRATALRAMGFTRSLAGLPLLGESAGKDPEALAVLAVGSAEMLAAEPRRTWDPEDALEVRLGCNRLKAAAADASRPKAVRDGAARAVRMLADLGC